MADEHGANSDRPAMSELPNQPAPQARPASKINDSASTSIPLCVPSNSPRPQSHPPPESMAKTALLESQPMTTSSSSSSLPPDQPMDTAGASPYGTRSRNRTGNPRPNYAEDRELDMEYEWTSYRKSQSAVSSTMPSNLQSGESDKASAGNTRRSSTAAPNGLAPSNKATISNTQNNNIPGMSSFSVHPDYNVAAAAPVPTRKRKAPGSGLVASYTPPNATQAPASAVSRRHGVPPQPSRLRPTNLMTFEGSQCYLKNGKLKADDSTVLAVNDQVYLVCEPPGEPYYLARIMEFLHVDNDQTAPVDSLRVNWFLRPRDIPRKVNDTRFVYASMQSDTSPITSLRGKCKILHRSDIADLDAYRKEPNSFWYEKLFDRYIHRFYDVIPTGQVINLPAKVKKVLDERWKFIIMEIGKGRELTSATKSCKRCQGYCASGDSVDCAVCKNTYHMNCVRPPLLKKPARGFGWSCGPCSRKQEKKLEARNTAIVGEKAIEGEEGEPIDDEDEEHAAASKSGNGDISKDVDAPISGSRPPTAEQVAQAKLWPFRYLGIHCRVEDALDYDDRIYPRATSRLGPKHQATVQTWPGRRVEYVRPGDVKKKFLKGNSHKKEAKLTKDTIAALEADKIAREKRPKWVMDEPPGYVPRGEDYRTSDPRNTAKLIFRLPQVGETSSRGGESSDASTLDQRETVVDDYMRKAKALAPLLGLQEYSTNFLDKALELLVANNYQSDHALQQLRNINKRKDLKEPEFSKEEVKRFEDGVRKFGSELRFVKNHVKSQKYGDIVRFYYMWKKTPEGKKIWGAYEGRKGKKQQKQMDSKLVDDVADDVDDSAFDNTKAAARRRGFECKFCGIRTSPHWRRAPATAPGTTVAIDPSLKNSKDKSAHLMLAICQRCAYLWRCYAIQWENPDEVAKKVANGGGRAWKRRVDEELLAELTTASVASSMGISTTAAAAAAAIGVDVPPNLTIQPGQDGPKKKQKLIADTPAMMVPQNVALVEPPKKKVAEKPPEPALIPEQPKLRILPCAICWGFIAGEEATDEGLCCTRCRLTVHRNCYGVADGRQKDKWNCDMCTNDTAHQVSTNYDCVLCSVREYTDTELMEAPKTHHKKKDERQKEKERLERELLINATEMYYRSQREKGRPEQPRQPLKRTTNNNWVHVVCAIFHPELRFSDPKTLEPAEGFGAIPLARFRLRCKLCKKSEGACVNCSQCQANIHVACAQQFGYQLGFDITPVKGSRANAVNMVDMNGDKGTAAAVIYCKEHTKAPFVREKKTGIHDMAEILTDLDNPDSKLNALQAYVRSHKQADTSLTGTLRKALMLDSATSTATQIASAGMNRHSSTSSASGATSSSALAPVIRGARVSPGAVTVRSDEVDQDGDRVFHLDLATPAEPDFKDCVKCGTTVSPKWHAAKPKVTSGFKEPPMLENVVKESGSSQPVIALPHDHVNSCHDNGVTSTQRDSSAAPILSSQPEGATVVNGGLDGDGAVDQEDHTDATLHGPEPLVHGKLELQESAISHVGEELPKYLCNKCYQRKRHEPTPPPRTPTPQPDPVETEPEIHASNECQVEIQPSIETDPISPSVRAVWPSQVAQTSSQEAYHGWPRQSVPPTPTPAPAPTLPPPAAPYHAPERLPNGIPHSPTVVAPPPPQHYPPPPQHQAVYVPPPPPQNYRDSRGVLHRGMPPQYHAPHLVNGVPVEAPSFQYRRDSSGNLYQVPYVPPAMRQQSSTLRSPHVHDRSSQGPHGPPEAAENPFAVPNTSHSPPRQPFNGIYGSPPGHRERPETPPDGLVREGRWGGDAGMANGASASPSLRNLLH